MSTEGQMVDYPVSGVVARLEVERKETADICSLGNIFNVYTAKLGKVVDLPPYKNGVTLIVPALVAEAMKETRPDLVSIGEEIRDENGMVMATNGLQLHANTLMWVEHLCEIFTPIV